MITLEQRIEKKNRRVEIDKKRGTIITRRVLVVIFAYLLFALYLKFILGIDAWISLIAPALSFLICVQTLPFLKPWIKQQKKN